MTRPESENPEFSDDELAQVVKALGIRQDSLASKLRRVEGRQREQALEEHHDCLAALQKAQDAQARRLARE